VKDLPRTPALLAVARRVVWFEPPETALADPVRFLAYAMSYGTHEDMREVRRHVADDDLRAALAAAPPGIIDPRSWAYWHLVVDRYPPPPLPRRRL
jgi:hypothetical protein